VVSLRESDGDENKLESTCCWMRFFSLGELAFWSCVNPCKKKNVLRVNLASQKTKKKKKKEARLGGKSRTIAT